MHAEEIVRHLADATREGAPARALPAECYLDEDFFQLEVDRVFRRDWHAVARRDQLPQPGDYRAIDLLGTPLVLVRDEEHRLRAYSRICLHRAFPIVSGSGNAKRLVCPFHRWSYDLDGRLRAAPLMDQVTGFDRDTFRLPELPLEEWQGFVMVSTNAHAEPLAPRMKPLDELLDPLGFCDFVSADVLEFDSPWNWKVMVENFMESYHHQGPHAETLQRTNPAKGTHALDLKGPFAALENPGVGGAPPFWVFQVFPTLLFALGRGDRPLGSWYEMEIDRRDHLHLRIHILASEKDAADPGTMAFFRDYLNTIHHQDIPMCEGVQRGLKSPLWEPGRLSNHEATLLRFHRYLAERLTG